MARPPIQALVAEKVAQYIERSLASPVNEMPLSTLAVATSIRHDRRVLKKYGLDLVIAQAAKKKARAAKSGAKSLDERLEANQRETDRLSMQSGALLAQLALIEGNAKRLGIDPEELYKPLVPPDRRVSSVFKGKSRRGMGRG